MRKFRKTRGMTQEELAKNSNLSTMSIRRYESGERIVTDEALQRIANALEISIYELKGLSDVEAFKAELNDSIDMTLLEMRIHKKFGADGKTIDHGNNRFWRNPNQML